MPEDSKYYAIINGKRLGPLSAHELIDVGLNEQHYVWKPGMEQWLPAIQAEEFVTYFHQGCVPPPPPPEAVCALESHKIDKPKFQKKFSGFFTRSGIRGNKRIIGSDRNDNGLKIGIWLLTVSAVCSIWMSFQGMFLIGYWSDYYISMPCIVWAMIIIILTIGYFIKYRKFKNKSLPYITIGLLLAAIFPTVRLFATFDGSYYMGDYRIICLKDKSNNLYIYNKWGDKVHSCYDERTVVYGSDHQFVVLNESTLSLYTMSGRLIRTYGIEVLDSKASEEQARENYKDIVNAVDDFFGDYFWKIGGEIPGVKYIRIVNNSDLTMPADNSESKSSADASSSYETERDSKRKQDQTSSKPERHETTVPVQEWRQCTNCFGSGQCPYCNGQGHSINMYGNDQDCPVCTDGRCVMCAGHGGHYETEYHTRVDYY